MKFEAVGPAVRKTVYPVLMGNKVNDTVFAIFVNEVDGFIVSKGDSGYSLGQKINITHGNGNWVPYQGSLVLSND